MPRDLRTYITVHDGLPEHPKVEPLSDGAFRLLLTAWCYCSKNLTDGRITRAAWEKRGTKKTREELVLAGLAVVQPDSSVEMHDYTEHQRTAAEVSEMRDKRADAGRKGGLAKASNRLASASELAKQTASNVLSKSVAESETDTEELERSSSKAAQKRGTRLPDDWNPDPAVIEAMRAERRDLDLKTEHAKFCDFWHAKAGRDAAKLDWNATWRIWMRNARSATQSNGRPLAPVPAYVSTPAPRAEDLPWAADQ